MRIVCSAAMGRLATGGGGAISQDSSRYRQRRRQRAKDFSAPRIPATGCETARSGLASGLPTIVQVAHPFADVLRRRCGLLLDTRFGKLR